MKKYFSLIWQIYKLRLMREMEYKPGFIMLVFGVILRVAVYVFLFWAIYQNVLEIDGWRFQDTLLLVATFELIDYVMSFCIFPSLLYQLPQDIYWGDFDLKVTKPVNPLIFSSIQHIEVIDIAKLASSIAIYVYVFTNYQFDIHVSNILMYICTMAFGIIFISSLVILMSSLTFYTVQGWGFGEMLEEYISLAHYPSTVFKGLFGKIFVYLIPLIIVATLPVQVLTGNADYNLVFYAMTAAIILFIISIFVWFNALKKYKSSGN